MIDVPGGSHTRKGAILGLVVAGAVLAGWLWTGRHAAPAENGAVPGASGGKSHYAWLPWLGGDPAASGSRSAADPYKGPRIPVTVKVIDVDGHPVRGANVEARAEQDEYEAAGLTDEEYEQFSKSRESDGSPTAAPTSEAGGEDDPWRSAPRVAVESGRSDREGIFVAKLKPDVAVVFYASDGLREGVSGMVYIYSAEEQTTSPPIGVTLEIGEVGSLAGKIVDERGHPVAGADLHLTPRAGDGGADAEELVVARAGVSTLTSGDDGRFRIPIRASGAFDLEIHARGFQAVIRQALQVLPAHQTDVDITMLASASITGRVVDPDGKAVSGARIVVQGNGTEDNASSASMESVTDTEGNFEVEELAPGVFTVAASADGLRPTELWGINAGGPPLTLRLSGGGKIHGVLAVNQDLLKRDPPPEGDSWGDSGQCDVYLSASGEDIALATGVPGERLQESPSGTVDSRGRYFASVAIDPDGKGDFELGGLPPGNYVLTFTIGSAVSSLPPLRIYDGATAEVRARIPDGSSSSVSGILHLADGTPLSTGSAFLYGALPAGLSAATDADGRFTFPSVPPGDYMLHAVASIHSENAAELNAFAPARAVHVPPGGTTLDILAEVPADGPLDQADGGVGGVATADDPVGDEGSVQPEPTTSPDAGWAPDVGVDELDDGLVVTHAAAQPGGKRLFGGDRVTSIDGNATTGMDAWQAMELLYGPKGTLCNITVQRPATGETLMASYPRVHPPEDDSGGQAPAQPAAGSAPW